MCLGSIPGSAVCAFYMEDIENVFNRRFKEQRTTDLSWTPVADELVPQPRWVSVRPGVKAPMTAAVLIWSGFLCSPGLERVQATAPLLTTSLRFSFRMRC